jgi:hypothetical protein
MQSPQDPEASVTVKEAASRIGYSIRQTDRFIQNGILKATHVNKSLRTVTVASIEAFHRTHGNRPVDPLDPLREQLYTHEQLTSDLLHQQALLRQQISAQDAALRQRYSDLEAQLRLLKTQLQQERDARHTLEQMVAAISLTGPTGHRPRKSGDTLRRPSGSLTLQSSMASNPVRCASMRRKRRVWRPSTSGAMQP